MDNHIAGSPHSAQATHSQRASGFPDVLLRSPVILVIEPSITLRTLLPIMLRRTIHAQVLAFPDALGALRHLRRSAALTPDVIFVTKRLPFLPGYAAARLLDHRYPQARVVMVMEDEGCLARVKARLAGAEDIVLKPYTLQAIQRVIRSAVAGECS